MIHFREHWEGVSLAEDYTLEQWLGGDDTAAFFQTSFGPDRSRAVVKLIPEAVDGDAPLDLWFRTRQLRHPNLIELLDCGRAGHRGEIVLYAVFESPDDTLASALSQSPLTPQEAREVLDSVLEALRYLHAQGLVLGALDPDHIVAVGDRIKLSTVALRYADSSSAYRDDVRLLGDLWQHSLMSASPRSTEIAAHAVDPNPETRWTLAEINAALTPPLPVAPPPPPVPEPPVALTPTVDREYPPAAPPSPRRIRERAAPYPFPKWIIAGTVAVLLLIVALNRPHRAAVAPPPRPIPVTLPTSTPPPAPAPVPHVAVPKSSPPAGKEMWRVIAFTYRTRDAAAKKAQELNQHHPALNAAVFSPRNKRGYYLVSLGGRMTHEDAVRLQRTARGKGLPRDLYVQNYLE